MPPPPQPTSALLPRLLAHLERADLEGAAAAARQAATSLAPGPARVLLAMVLFAAGYRDEALAELDRCEAVSPDNARSCRATLLRASGRPRAALDALEQLALSPARRGDALASAAELRALYHDEHGALDDINRAIDALPATPPLHLTRAALLERTGDVDGARAAAVEASRLPSPAVFKTTVSRQLTRLGLFDEARALAEGAASDPEGRPAALAEQARLALFRGDLPLARRLADEALAADASQPVALLVQGALLARDDQARALACLDEAITRDPTCPEARLHRAELRLRQGDVASALADLDAATSHDPESFSAHALRLLAGACRSPHLVSAYATESVRQGVERLAPHTLEALDSGAPQRVAHSLEASLSALSHNRSSSLSRAIVDGDARTIAWVGPIVTPRFAAKWAAESCVVAGPEAALARLERVMAAYPTSTKPHCYRGELRLWIGDTAGARADFEQALSRDITTKWAHIGLVAVHMLEGRHEQALEAAARGLTHVGPGPTLYIHRGEAHRRRGDLDAALADITHACAAQPSRVSAFVNLGLLQLEKADHDGLARTLARLSWQARWMLHDAASSLGAPARPDRVDPRALLDRCLEMMRGNRSSSCITYFVGDELRVVPFVRSPDSEPALVATRRALARAASARSRPAPEHG